MLVRDKKIIITYESESNQIMKHNYKTHIICNDKSGRKKDQLVLIR